jgi:uncharacterized membrane-anchored protein YhcB (DUF1043 family)
MKPENLLDEIENANKISRRLFGVSLLKTVIALLIAVSLGFYVSNLTYGVNSWSVVQNLQAEVNDLKNNIDNLKKENAVLHKKYFDFQHLENESYRLNQNSQTTENR